MQLDLSTTLAIHAGNIYSDSKSVRQNARAQFIRLTDGCKSYPQCTQGCNLPWVKVAEAVKNAILSNTFPYRIHPKEVCYEIIKPSTIANPLVSPIVRGVPLDPRPGYVVLMAHQFKPATDTGVNRIQHQIALLQNEGFGATSQASNQEAQARLRVVIGANFCYSLDSQINKAGYRYFASLGQLNSPTTTFKTFMWTPLWINCEGLLYSNEGALKKAKRLFRLIKDVNPAAADKLCKTLFAIKPIPYQLIREEVKNANPVLSYVVELRRGQMNRPVFAATWDDDAISLRTEGEGVFSCYDQLIAENPQLQVASTGYIMKDPLNDYIESASRADLAFRRALGRFAYLPEPNILVRVPMSAVRGLGFKYLLNKKAKDFTWESDRVLKSLGLDFSNSRSKIIFGRKGPIETTPDRAVVPQGLYGVLNPQDYASYEKIVKFRDLMQCSFNPLIGFAHNVIRAFPKLGERPYYSLVHKIYVTFDPIEFARLFKKDWLKLYIPYLTELLGLSNLKAIQRDIKAAVDRIVTSTPGIYVERDKIEKYLRDNISNLEEASSKFLDLDKVTENKLKFIRQSAINASFTLFVYFRSKAMNEPFAFPNLPEA